jgi:hypothetical protein
MGRIAIIVIVAAALCGCASTPNKEPAPGATIERPPPRRPVAPPPAKEKPLPRELSQEEDPGFYMMKLQILSDGSVSKVAPVRVPTRKEDPRPYADLPPDVDGGKDPHSPTSACLVRLLRSIKFPRFKGWPMDVQYPLILRHN